MVSSIFFVNLIHNGRPTITTGQTNKFTVLVAAAINESLATHGPVQVQPLLG